MLWGSASAGLSRLKGEAIFESGEKRIEVRLRTLRRLVGCVSDDMREADAARYAEPEPV